MCDYSLCGLPTRLAAEGEELIVHRFRGGSMGLASPQDVRPVLHPPCAARKGFWDRKGLWEWIRSAFEGPPNSPPVTVVCIPPGAHLLFEKIPRDLQKRWRVSEQENAFFVQTSAEVYNYRDAVQFCVGPPVILQDLREGMRVRLLSLGDACVDSTQELTAPAF